MLYFVWFNSSNGSTSLVVWIKGVDAALRVFVNVFVDGGDGERTRNIECGEPVTSDETDDGAHGVDETVSNARISRGEDARGDFGGNRVQDDVGESRG